MPKLNRASLLVFLGVAAFIILVLSKYRFLWPVALFIALGFTPAKDQKND
jgi:hypothetical protein